MSAGRAGRARGAEVVAALVSIFAGLIWALPADSFSRADTYKIMGDLAPEWIWAIAVIAVGLGVILLQQPGSLLPFIFVWGIITISWAVANPVAVGPGFALGLIANAVLASTERHRA